MLYKSLFFMIWLRLFFDKKKFYYIMNLNNLYIMEFYKFCYVWKYVVGYDWKYVFIIKEERDWFIKIFFIEIEELFLFF